MDTIYYSGEKLLSMSDLDGNTPEIFACVGNRAAGKTFYFKNKLVSEFLHEGKKFIDLVRFKYEVPDRVAAFYEDLKQVNFPDLQIDSKKMFSGCALSHEINGELAGYTIALSSADMIKKYSSMFVEVEQMFFDEFQSETMHYCQNEITKFQSIHNSVARGGGKQSRYVPIYMVSNNVSLLNPYFTAWGFTNRIQKNTKMLRGHGIVLEQHYNASAKKALEESAFNRAFADTDYLKYAASNEAMCDNNAFIENVSESDSYYLYTIQYEKQKYALWQNDRLGIMFLNRKVDPRRAHILVFKQADHDLNKLLIMRLEDMLTRWRNIFNMGLFRFSDLQAKQAMLDILAIR